MNYQTIKHLFHILKINPWFFLKRSFIELRAFVFPLPKSPLLKEIKGVSFNFDFNDEDKARKMYFGAFQPAVEGVLKRCLKSGDVFMDAGANVGYFSGLAAGLVGKQGEVHSFEPVPKYFERLKQLAEANAGFAIKANGFALGESEKTEKIYIGGDSHIGDNTFFPDFLKGIEGVESIDVAIRRADKYIEENNIRNIKLIKIDVEGYEFPVLLGFSGYFEKRGKEKTCPAIICEICPKAYSYLGYKLEDIFDYMKKFSYLPFDILNEKKRVDINKIKERDVVDVLFKPV
ncbi:MAG: FkbM family methyltransferase [Candidatus Staskawiczbacteria bacterium]|nr:FkbM family methyltransferase [Candidatus Staskawiczbacteria bacterium]